MLMTIFLVLFVNICCLSFCLAFSVWRLFSNCREVALSLSFSFSLIGSHLFLFVLFDFFQVIFFWLLSSLWLFYLYIFLLFLLFLLLLCLCYSSFHKSVLDVGGHRTCTFITLFVSCLNRSRSGEVHSIPHFLFVKNTLITGQEYQFLAESPVKVTMNESVTPDRDRIPLVCRFIRLRHPHPRQTWGWFDCD